MAKARNDPQGKTSVTVSASLHGVEAGHDQPALMAYAFSAGGELLSSAALEEGTARLPLPGSDQSQSVRVLVGPSTPEGAQPSLAELVRQGAIEAHLRVDPGAKLEPVAFPPIDSSIWGCWRDYCFVKGTLLKRVMRDGVWIDLPVCNATVDIWEVDPVEVVLPKIPIDVIDRLRAVVLKPPLPDPPPYRGGIPSPPPGPGPDPAPFVALAQVGGTVAPASLPAVQSEAFALAAAVRSLAADEPIRSAAYSGAEAFRAALLDRPELVRPLLCVLFPRSVTTRLITQVETDDCGHFSAWVWRGCKSLDLYFTAWQWAFGGFDPYPMQILRNTPVSCFTWWNYACGTEVTLHTTNPFARTCAPCPPVVADPRWVLAMAIGNWPISRIHGLSTSTPADGTNNGLTDGGAPFGADDIRLRLEFDDALAGLGVRYYQVSWKKAGTADSPEPLIGDVHRHYAYEVAGNLVVESYSLGPRTVGATWPLYEIPPALPPKGKWSYPDAVLDLTSAIFPSVSKLGSTKSALIELHVDLYDAGGNHVDIGPLGIHYVVPTSTDFSGTINTEDANVDGLVSGSTLVLPLFIDNNPTSATIDAPTLNGSPASDECGVLEYTDASTDSVTLSYHAHHPDGFATYSFALYRGVNEQTPPSQSGAVGAGNFSATETAGTLLGDCSIAGFSENLYVWAMAINGWRRLWEYDASAVRAFVLAPEQGE